MKLAEVIEKREQLRKYRDAISTNARKLKEAESYTRWLGIWNAQMEITFSGERERLDALYQRFTEAIEALDAIEVDAKYLDEVFHLVLEEVS